MRTQWQAILERIWSSRYDPAARPRYPIARLELFLALAIAAAAGPEVAAAMEMTALMELLGGILFLTAMRAGAALVVLSIWNAIYNILFPIPLRAIVAPGASVQQRAMASVYIALIAVWNLVLMMDCRSIASLNCAEGRA
jgi:hypothetical protein